MPGPVSIERIDSCLGLSRHLKTMVTACQARNSALQNSLEGNDLTVGRERKKVVWLESIGEEGRRAQKRWTHGGPQSKEVEVL